MSALFDPLTSDVHKKAILTQKDPAAEMCRVFFK